MTKRPFFDNVIAFFFILAGLYNLGGILYATSFFMDQTIVDVNPAVFSWFGQISVILWGLAYLSVSFSFYNVPKLVFVFFIEKMVYAVTWAVWFFSNQDVVTKLAETSPKLASFFKFYGAGDLFFGLFFLWVVIRTTREKSATLAVEKPTPPTQRTEPEIGEEKADSAHEVAEKVV
ncbi:hypothetical protein [Glaesserella sp.]|uniref:hypothetical protein n=1 Tax=Glaesserella sp. TaxID=2094731 RepID=UPI0035A04C6D